jgi:hypothetical protein
MTVPGCSCTERKFLLKTSQERAWIAELTSPRIMFRMWRRLLFWETVRGNKVTKTTLQEPGICIILADSGKIISQSPEPQSVSGDELYTPQVVYVTREFLQ